MVAKPPTSKELDRLQEIGSSLPSITDLDDLCWAIAAWVGELTDLNDCVVYVLQGNVLTQMAGLGAKRKQDTEREVLNRIGLPLGVGIIGSVGLDLRAEYIPDVSSDPRYFRDEFPGASEFAVPLQHQGELLGVIDTEHDEVDGIDAATRQRIEALAALVAPQLSALMHQLSNSRLDYGKVIADLAHQPDAIVDLRSVFAKITQRAAQTLGVSRAYIWLFNAERTEAECIDQFDLLANQHTSGMTLQKSAHPVYFAALRDERVLIASDARNDGRTADLISNYPIQANVYSMLDAPIRQNGQMVGVLGVEQTGQCRRWTNDEASFVATLSDFATIALISDQKNSVETALVHSQKLESLGRLAGGIAHDFNNLLTVISGAVETLRIKLEPDDSAERLLELIVDAAERAAKLTRNLSAFGGRQALTLEPVSASRLRDSIRQLTDGIIREDIRVTFSAPDQEVWARGDINQLEQVLLNMMINAVDAITGSGEIRVDFFAPSETQFAITVTDTGKGMIEEVRQRIFDPFFTTKGATGTGLGLSICQGIVQQHRGTLTCHTTPGVGTRFEILLPRADPPQDKAAEKTPEDQQAVAEHQTRILLVEDEIGVRNVLTQMLQALGFEPRVADDARHALEIIDASQIDLLLSDVIMPDMRGPELYREAIRRQPDLTALFVSGYTEEVIKEIPIGSARVGYLGKPFTMQELASALNDLTDDRASTA